MIGYPLQGFPMTGISDAPLVQIEIIPGITAISVAATG